jgi:hypothetical protein
MIEQQNRRLQPVATLLPIAALAIAAVLPFAVAGCAGACIVRRDAAHWLPQSAERGQAHGALVVVWPGGGEA